MNDYGANQDDDEQRVVEEVGKYVQLATLQLTAVYLIEDLKQHENVKEDRIMLARLVIPFAVLKPN